MHACLHVSPIYDRARAGSQTQALAQVQKLAEIGKPGRSGNARMVKALCM